MAGRGGIAAVPSLKPAPRHRRTDAVPTVRTFADQLPAPNCSFGCRRGAKRMYASMGSGRNEKKTM